MNIPLSKGEKERLGKRVLATSQELFEKDRDILLVTQRHIYGIVALVTDKQLPSASRLRCKEWADGQREGRRYASTSFRVHGDMIGR